jgi:hypothetical protein
MTPAGATCLYFLWRSHLKRGQENFCEVFREVAIQSQENYCEGLTGPPPPSQEFLALGCAPTPPEPVHTVDALQTALVERLFAAASGPPDARNGARPAITGSRGAPLPG